MDAELKRMELERGVLGAMDIAASRAMKWGVDDCSLWCADVLKGALGYDAGVQFRGRYKTARGARRALGRKGLLGALQGMARKHHWRSIAAGCEQPGDIGVLVSGKIASTVICRAPGWFVGRELNGYTAIPSRMVSKIWAVI